MHKTLRITVDGRSHDVVVEDLDPSVKPAAAPEAAPSAVAQPDVIAPPHPVVQASQPATPQPPSPAAKSGAAGAVVAPLGGTVVSIDVTVGQAVAVGDKVATIEAMKMKMEIRSKVAGKVTEISAKVNEPVDTGQALLTIG